MLPKQDLTVCVMSNCTDGYTETWTNGAIRIMRTFLQGGAPLPKLKSWNGRWWNMWGAIDLVPVGGVVKVASPNFGNPFADASDLDVIGRDKALVSNSSGFLYYAEMARRSRNAAGEIDEIWLGGDRFSSEAALAAETKQQFI
jgi:hypothetical protein